MTAVLARAKRENAHLRLRLEHAEAIIDLQKKSRPAGNPPGDDRQRQES